MSEEKKQSRVEEVFDAAKNNHPSWTGFPTPETFGQPAPPWASPYYVSGESEWCICTQHNTTAGIIPTIGMFNTLIIKPGDKCTITVQIRDKQNGYCAPFGKSNAFDATVISVTPDELKLEYRDDIVSVMREVTYTPDKFFNVDDNIDIRIASCKIKPYGMPIY